MILAHKRKIRERNRVKEKISYLLKKKKKLIRFKFTYKLIKFKLSKIEINKMLNHKNHRVLFFEKNIFNDL